MHTILVLDENETYNPTAYAVHQADVIVRKTVRYEVVKNRHGPCGQTVDRLDELKQAGQW